MQTIVENQPLQRYSGLHGGAIKCAVADRVPERQLPVNCQGNGIWSTPITRTGAARRWKVQLEQIKLRIGACSDQRNRLCGSKFWYLR